MKKFLTWSATLTIYLCGILTHESSLYYSIVAGLVAGILIFNE